MNEPKPPKPPLDDAGQALEAQAQALAGSVLVQQQGHRVALAMDWIVARQHVLALLDGLEQALFQVLDGELPVARHLHPEPNGGAKRLADAIGLSGELRGLEVVRGVQVGAPARGWEAWCAEGHEMDSKEFTGPVLLSFR